MGGDDTTERKYYNTEMQNEESRDIQGGSKRRAQAEGNFTSKNISNSASDGNQESSEEPKRRRRQASGWDDAPPAHTHTYTDRLSVSPGPTPSFMPPPVSPVMTGGYSGDRVNPGGQSTAMAALLQNKATQSQMCRIYVGSLDYSLTEEDLKQVFQAFGIITNIDMPKEGMRSKGFCFIEYDNPQSSNVALESMQGFILKSRPIKVGRPTAVGGASTYRNTASNQMSTPTGIGMDPMGGGLSSQSTMSAAQAGALAAANLMRNMSMPMGGMGLGADTSPIDTQSQAPYTQPQPLLQTQTQTHTHINTQVSPPHIPTISPVYGQQSTHTHTQNTIYVTNIPLQVGRDELKSIFGTFGEIEDCNLLSNAAHTNPSDTSSAYIHFVNSNAAQDAASKMNLFEISGKLLNVAPVTSSPQDGSDPTHTHTHTHTHAHAHAPSNIVLLSNISGDMGDELKDEIEAECERLGKVKNVDIRVIGSDIRCFVTYERSEDAEVAAKELNGRCIADRAIQSCLYDVTKYNAGIYTQ